VPIFRQSETNRALANVARLLLSQPSVKKEPQVTAFNPLLSNLSKAVWEKSQTASCRGGDVFRQGAAMDKASLVQDVANPTVSNHTITLDTNENKTRNSYSTNIVRANGKCLQKRRA